ncbi:MAG: PilZ domain-containing protein [Deltaproteobacteria bacterium]|nr:PilZ domain-containing protein [Deltaproteobacteria bacterium]MDQ3298291.1 PilZ domain-containing protein [Myxococcota bacterium]
MNLRVAYQRAQEFVEQYAENLSAGGLFVRDAQGLAMREEVNVDIDLPGYGTYSVIAEVAHISPAGAGLHIKAGPPGFQQALTAYLLRLGKRTHATVFVDHEPWRGVVRDAGYAVQPLPPPSRLVELIGDATAVGILAPEDIAEQYRNALGFLGDDGTLVIAVHAGQAVGDVLTALDAKLLDR